MIVTITGDPGAGKSTIGKRIAEKYGLKHFSAGDFVDDLARERGMTLMELSKEAEKGREIDEEIDRRTVKLAEEEKDFVIDSRLAWHFIPKSVKIYLRVDLDEGARRIFKESRQAEKENVSLEKTKENIGKRIASEVKRYKEYYGIDFRKPENFDVVIDTTDKTIEEVFEKACEAIEDYKGVS